MFSLTFSLTSYNDKSNHVSKGIQKNVHVYYYWNKYQETSLMALSNVTKNLKCGTIKYLLSLHRGLR